MTIFNQGFFNGKEIEKDGVENMKMHKHPLMPWIVFLFCILIVAPLQAQGNYTAIYKKSAPSVVTILRSDGGFGSGFFVNKYGGIITNYHVIKGATSAWVKTADGQVYPVKNIVGANEQCDLALISVEIPSNLVYPLSVSLRTPEVGETIIVVGSPQGFEQSLSTGIVSGFREWSPCGEVMQITAPISHGSSGGPVLNMKGHVVGVAVAFWSAGQNINFAILGQRIASLKSVGGETVSQRESKGKEDRVASAKGLYTLKGKELEKLKNSTYQIVNLNGEEFKLTNGIYERRSSSSGYDYALIQMVKVAFGDLNKDGEEDAAAIIEIDVHWNAEEIRGKYNPEPYELGYTRRSASGTYFFTELAAVVFRNGKPYHVASADLGNNVKIESISIESGRIILHMLGPTVKTVVEYKLSENKLVKQ